MANYYSPLLTQKTETSQQLDQQHNQIFVPLSPKIRLPKTKSSGGENEQLQHLTEHLGSARRKQITVLSNHQPDHQENISNQLNNINNGGVNNNPSSLRSNSNKSISNQQNYQGPIENMSNSTNNQYEQQQFMK
eukprot:403331212